MSTMDALRSLGRSRLMRVAALTVLLGGIGARALKLKYFITDNDLWWHLKVGDWIVHFMAVPHTGIYSRTAANFPWVAYSWGYEVMLSRAYAWFGLVGVGIFGILLTIGVAYATYWMLLRLSGRFWLSLAGTAIICWAFLFTGSPRPHFFSMILFAVVLTLLVEANRSGKVEILYWLPPIFAIWTNLHIQFIYGLFPVGLLMAVCTAQHLLERWGWMPDFLQPIRLPVEKLALIFGGCLLATLIGPNLYHPYIAVFKYSQAKFSYSIIQELQPLAFRDIRNYIELFLAATAFFAIGRRKKLDAFQILLLATACVLAFRTLRDGWFLCLCAGAILFDHPAPEEVRDTAESWPERAAGAVLLAVLLFVAANLTHFNQRGLDRAISADYPVDAVNYLRRHPVPGPLYNDLNWGGFLIWYMPQYPVAIDGRNDLYGDEIDRLFFNTGIGEASYKTDPYLDEAGVVILPVDLPLAQLLTIDARFRLIYRDKIAVVYARNWAPQWRNPGPGGENWTPSGP